MKRPAGITSQWTDGNEPRSQQSVVVVVSFGETPPLKGRIKILMHRPRGGGVRNKGGPDFKTRKQLHQKHTLDIFHGVLWDGP